MQSTRKGEPGHSQALDELLERARQRRCLPPAPERRRIRESAGVSQRELGRALGVSWTAVQRWEAGAHPRTHAAAYALALEKLGALTRRGANDA